MLYVIMFSVPPTAKDIRGSGFVQASMSKIQGLLKASPTVFKDLMLMKILIQVLKVYFRNARLR